MPPGHGGSGLGLAIARGFVDANGGTIRAESLPGQGTAIVIELPVEKQPAGGGRTGRGVAVSAARVLVCDDEPQIVRALRVVLREAGFQVIAASDGEEALDHAAVQPPDAAIIDLVLPDIDGVEVCRRLREWTSMPIIVLSAVGDEVEKVRALEAGADDYVTKPFGSRELVARLQATMRRAGAVADEPVLVAGDLEIDLAARVVRRDGEEVHLTPIEFSLLAALARNRGPPADPPRAADRGLGPRARRGHRGAPHPHRQPAPEDRPRRLRDADQDRSRGRLPARGRLSGARNAGRAPVLTIS